MVWVSVKVGSERILVLLCRQLGTLCPSHSGPPQAQRVIVHFRKPDRNFSIFSISSVRKSYLQYCNLYFEPNWTPRMNTFLKNRADQGARLENDLDVALRAHVASTTAQGNSFLSDLVNSDALEPPSSPPRWPVGPHIPGSSPLSSPPKRLDRQLEQIWALALGDKNKVIGLSKEEALDKAISEIDTNTDRRGFRKVTLADVARDFAVAEKDRKR